MNFLLAAIVLLAPPQADTLFVAADGAPVWGDVVVREGVVIGALDGPEEVTFGLLGTPALGLDGTIWINDVQVPVVRRFGPDGSFLGQVGREGQGPGEYGIVLGMRTQEDGRVATWDPRNTRVNVYNSAGVFESGFVVPAGLFSSDVFQVGTEGDFFVKTVTDHGQQQGDPWTFAWIHLGSDGETLDTIPIPPEDSSPSYVLSGASGGREPFPVQTVSTLSRNGYIIQGRTDAYRFSRPLPDGRILVVSRQYDPVRIGRGERQMWEAYSDRFESRNSAGFERPRIPETKPAFRGLFEDDDGRIWVSRYADAYEADLTPQYVEDRRADGRPLYSWREPNTWDVFHPAGQFLGTVVIPPDTYPSVVRGDVILGTRRGEYNEGYVVVLHIERNR